MNILFADFQALTREGIRSVIRRNHPEATFSEAYSRQDLLAQINTGQFTLSIIDPVSFDDFDFSDIALTRAQKQRVAFFIFTSSLSPEFMTKALDYNVDAFLTKDCDVSEFSKAVEAVLVGKKYYCPELSEFLYKLHSREKQNEASNNKKHLLTTKEEEIVRLIGEGLSAKEIANRLFISVHTSNTHRKNIYRKCSVRNASELVMFAVKTGIIEKIEYYI
ncbi:MAG: response regulator transcription factor [Bacteroidales bacterium]|nr:response regulator transcription factor [Bacteroidales bacterium]